MFDAIAGRYDLLNRVLSGGLDQWWRRAGRQRPPADRPGNAARSVHRHRRCGALACRRGAAARAVGVDFSHRCSASAWRRSRKRNLTRHISLMRGDATRIPLASGSVDAATIAFGIRNVQQPEAACVELARVVRRGGRLAILEFGLPRVRGRPSDLPLVLEPALTGDRQAGIAARKRVRLPAGIGQPLPGAGGLRTVTAGVRFPARGNRPSQLRDRLPIRGAALASAGIGRSASAILVNLLMYFDFQDGHPDLERVPSALSAREGVLLSIIVHLLVIIAVLLLPQLPFLKARGRRGRRLLRKRRGRRCSKSSARTGRSCSCNRKVELQPLRPPPPRRAPVGSRPHRPLEATLPQSQELAAVPSRQHTRVRGAVAAAARRAESRADAAGRGHTGRNAERGPRSRRGQSAAVPRRRNATAADERRERAGRSDRSARVKRCGTCRGSRSRTRSKTRMAATSISSARFSSTPRASSSDPGSAGSSPRSSATGTCRMTAMSLHGHVVITFNVHKNGALTDITVIAPRRGFVQQRRLQRARRRRIPPSRCRPSIRPTRRFSR